MKHKITMYFDTTKQEIECRLSNPSGKYRRTFKIRDLIIGDRKGFQLFINQMENLMRHLYKESKSK